jgi:HSP20 family protein
MSNLTRWEPVREMMSLREAMDRLFDDAFTHPLSSSGVSAMPALDVYQTPSDVVVKAALPGLKPEEVQITVTADVLTLKGEFKQESEQKENAYLLREQRYGAFERSVALPTEVQADKARADFTNGLLTITLPKAEAIKPRTITIKPR